MNTHWTKPKFQRSEGPYVLTRVAVPDCVKAPGFDIGDYGIFIDNVDHQTIADMEAGEASCAPSSDMLGNAYLLASSWDLLRAATMAEQLLTTPAPSVEQIERTLQSLRSAIAKSNGHDGEMLAELGGADNAPGTDSDDA